MNFNQHSNEYDLSGSVTEELIRLYGAPLKLIITKKINRDLTFGDFSHFKADNRACFEIFGMPENSEEFDQYERLQTQFGVLLDTSIGLYVSKISTFNLVQPSMNSKNEYDVTLPDSRIHDLIGSLIIVPSGKILEITEITLDCFGLNNVFLYNQYKNVYKFKCKTYVFRKSDELENDFVIRSDELLDKQTPNTDMHNELEKYFDELSSIKDKQQQETKDFYTNSDDVFGRF
ncbi:hypothetical protein ACNGMK_09505 [Campylobacter coli]